MSPAKLLPERVLRRNISEYLPQSNQPMPMVIHSLAVSGARQSIMPTSRFRFGSFEIDVSSSELRKSGLRIRLEEQPFRILAMLVSRPGEVVTREQLREAVWNSDTHVDFDRSLTRAVNKLRLAINDSASNPRFVETLPRRGYRFTAPVTPISEESLRGAVAEGTTDVAGRGEAPSDHVPDMRAGRGGFLRWAVTLILAAAVLAVGVSVGRRLTPARVSAVAVLPFQNLSAQPERNYLGDGMTDQLIITLSRMTSVRVVSRTSVMRYKGGRHSLADIASNLKVDSILEGSVTEDGKRVLVNARLIGFPGGRILWTRSYDRTSADLPALQAELAQTVAREIGALFAPRDELRVRAAARKVDPEVHALYLQGRLFVSEPDRPTVERGIEALKEVLRREPGHADAWAALADGWFNMSSNYVTPLEAMPKAKSAARKAVELDPESDAAHAVLGRIHVFYDWDWRAGEEHLRKAIDLNPNSSSAWRGLSFLEVAEGRFDDAFKSLDRALLLDPMSLWARFQSVITLTCVRRHDEAIQQAQRGLEWEPEFGIMRSVLGLAHAEKGDFPAAIGQLERAVESQKVVTTLAFLAQGYARAGRRMDADRIMSQLLSRATTEYVCPFEMGAAFASMGRTEEAFAWLNKSVTERADCMIWLRAEPWLSPIRGDPRYAALVRQVGFR
jgi:TolB-like protein/DNA-binding winged helix-turn-helix (wHTH) protein/Flp pilus assembly protein TadD